MDGPYSIVLLNLMSKGLIVLHMFVDLFFLAKRRPDRLSAESNVTMQKILCQGGETDLYLAVQCQKNVSVGDKHEIRNNLKMSRGRQK